MRVVLSNASHAWGGVHLVTETLARGLGARGHEVLVVCRPGSALEERLRGVAPLAPVARGMDLNPLALWRIRRALGRFRPDVVLTLMNKDVRLTGPVARAMGIPVVVRRANDQPLDRGPYTRAFYGALPALHVANSRATRRTMLDSAPWLRPERVRVIHNGIDPAAYEEAVPADLGLPDGAVALGFVGRFDARKGVRELAEAWPSVAEALPNAWLVVVGKGPLEGELRGRLEGAPRVRWLGFRTDVPAVMRALDVLAVPSHWEGFGIVAAEALAAGTPVIAADASSLPEIVRDGVEGRLVPPRDAAALGRALAELGGDAALRERMGRAGRERVRAEFSMERMVDRYDELLRAVAERRTLEGPVEEG